MEKKFRFTVLMVLALAVGLTAGAANAVLIAYEPFDYGVGEGLLTQDGGTGWGGPWRDGAWGGGGPPLIAADSPMPGGTGNHVALVSDFAGAGGAGADIVRRLGTILPDDGSDYWISVVYQKANSDNSSNWFGFGVGPYIMWGKGWGADDFWLWDEFSNIEGQIVGRDEGVGTGKLVTELSQLVVKIEGNATGWEDVYLWVNPPAGDEPDTGTADAYLDIPLSGPKEFQWFEGFGIVYSSEPAVAHCDDFILDEIKIGTTWDDVKPIPPCEKTSVPVPANDAQNVDPNILDLRWTKPSASCVPSPTYDVYFGTDPNVAGNPKIATDITDPCTLTPVGDLNFNTQYYWRADVNGPTLAISAFADLAGTPNELRATTADHDGTIEVDSYVTIAGTANYNGPWQVTNVSDNTHFDFEHAFVATESGSVDVTHEGFDWSFTTWPAEPIITTQPAAAQTVPPGSNVTFTVVSGGNEAGTHAYQWYHHANVGDANSLMAGKTSATLNLTNIQSTPTPGNEGYYVCDVNNTSGATYSDSGRLLTPRLMAHWKFDNAGPGNYYEETGTYPASAAGAAPSFVTGIDGQAVLIEGEPNKFIMVNGTIGPLNDITVSMWVKPNDANDAIFFAPQATEAEGYGGTGSVHLFELLDTSTGTADFYGEIQNGVYLGEPNALTVGEWNNIVFVYDTNDTNAVARYHVNGDLVPIGGVYEHPIDYSILPIVHPLSMGRRNGEDTWGMFNGRIDDVKVWNYPREALQIALDYIAFVPAGMPCIGPVEFDLNSDCIVNLAEYAALADAWLDCNIVPDCLAPDIPE